MTTHQHCSHTIHAETPPTGAGGGGLPPEIVNLINSNTLILEKVFQISRDDLLIKFSYAQNMDQLYAMLKATINSNVLVIPRNEDNLKKLYDNVGRAWDYGISREGNPNYVTQLMRDSVTQSTEKYVTKLDSDVKTRLSDTINRTMEQNRTQPPHKRVMPEQLARNMATELDRNVPRARMIARTETMRASNLGSWTQAKNEGAQYFVVDNRAEACHYCFKISRMGVFSIDETKYIPPFHPNCACFLHFFSDKDLAEMSADEIRNDNVKRRKDLEDRGYTLPEDGTGPLAPGVTQSEYREKRRRYNEAVKKQL